MVVVLLTVTLACKTQSPDNRVSQVTPTTMPDADPPPSAEAIGTNSRGAPSERRQLGEGFQACKVFQGIIGDLWEGGLSVAEVRSITYTIRNQAVSAEVGISNSSQDMFDSLNDDDGLGFMSASIAMLDNCVIYGYIDDKGELVD